jgi:hypothetical protein
VKSRSSVPEDSGPPPASASLRQQLAACLAGPPRTFDELCTQFELGPRQLESELGHLDRSLRHRGARLLVEPAWCRACDYHFRPRPTRPFHAPGRCPVCRTERIAGPRFQVRSSR